ncbi:MAG: XdhC family protein [Planctomycetes bacterium]|nr:XdhC family protein [Planctomycetota bacterium]
MAADIYREIVRLRQEGVAAALATIVDRKGSTPGKLAQKMIVRADGDIVGTIGGGCVEADVIRAARHVIDTGIASKLRFTLSGEEAERSGLACGGVLEIMIENLNDPRLVVVGCGHVGERIANLAAACGFMVTVVDDRPDFAARERFPEVDEVLVAPLDRLDPVIVVRPNTFLISVTRGHDHDYEVLRWALERPFRFIGVIGSRSKALQFRKRLAAESGRSEAAVGEFQCPVGLPIGADTPDEIAVSVVAELVKLRRLGD